MARTRGTALFPFVVALAVVGILIEGVIVFGGATGAGAPGVLSSPYVLVSKPLVFFLLVAGVVRAWALSGDYLRTGSVDRPGPSTSSRA